MGKFFERLTMFVALATPVPPRHQGALIRAHYQAPEAEASQSRCRADLTILNVRDSAASSGRGRVCGNALGPANPVGPRNRWPVQRPCPAGTDLAFALVASVVSWNHDE
jgi:hypothetical protein